MNTPNTKSGLIATAFEDASTAQAALRLWLMSLPEEETVDTLTACS